MKRVRDEAGGEKCERKERVYNQTRRQPSSLDTIHAEREKRALFRLPRTEFTRRQRYRDSNQNAFAPALASDPLYKMLQHHNLVDTLDDDDALRATQDPCQARGLPVPKKRAVVDQDGTTGTLYGSAVLYVEMRADNRLHKWPTGDLEFVDPQSDRLLTGRIEKSVFDGRSKGGYVVLRDVVDWGRLANPAEFKRAKK